MLKSEISVTAEQPGTNEPTTPDEGEKTSPPAAKGIKSKKWQVLRRGMFGLLAFLVINLVAVLLEPFFLSINSYQLTHTTEKILLYEDQPKPDIIFLGSSRAENGFDPAEVTDAVAAKTGVRPRALNLGIANGSFALNYLLLKNIIQQNKQPSVIVYGISELELDTTHTSVGRNYYENIVKAIPNSGLLFRPDDLAKYGGSSPDQQAAYLFNQAVPLFRDQALILQGLDIMFNSQNSSHANYVSKVEIPANGFWPNDLALTQEQKELKKKVYQRSLPGFQIRKEDVAFFQDFLDLAKSRGIKVVLVNMPVNAEHLSFWKNDAKVTEYTGYLQNLAKQNSVPLLDLYRNPGNFFGDADFFDTNHLSHQGATRLSEYVASQYLADFFKVDASTVTSGDFFKSQLSDLQVPPRLPTGFFTNGTVSITNLSQSFWPVSGDKRVRLSYHWYNADGTVLTYEGERTDFPYSITPGQTQNLTFRLQTPPNPGQYILEVDLVYEFVGWFSKRQGSTLRQTVIVKG